MSNYLVNDANGNINITSTAVSVGPSAGRSSNNNYSVSIGYQSGYLSGPYSVAVGDYAGRGQGTNCTAVGESSGNSNQGNYATCIGNFSGQTNQGVSATALGDNSGRYSQGQYALALGAYAGNTNQPANSIVLNATGSNLNGSNTSASYIAPIRNDTGSSNVLLYNTTTKELTTGSYTGSNFQCGALSHYNSTTGYFETYNGNALQMTSQAAFRFLIGNIGSAGYVGKIYGSGFEAIAFNTTSDDRIKTNESFITDAITTVNKLRPQIYHKYNNFALSGNYSIESGLIAQEIYYDIPELRHLIRVPDDATFDTSGNITSSIDPTIDPIEYNQWGSTPTSVNYTGVLPYLVKAIQEQQVLINNLTLRIETLEG